MTTYNHTAIVASPKQAANAATFNGPLAELDTAIGAAVSTLTTTAKNVVGAINELDAQIGTAASSSGTLGTSIDTDGTLNSGAVDVAAVVTDGILTNAKLATDVKVGSLASLTTTTKTSVQAAINEVNGLLNGVLGGAAVTAQTLKAWAEGGDYEMTSITVDSDQVVTTATVKWPDGSAGTFTTTTKNSTWLAVDAYTISHTDSSQIVTQTAVTRNSSGTVITKPALTVV